MNEHHDLRRAPRYPVRVRVRLRREAPPSAWEEGTLLTASGGGAFVKTACPAAVGETVELELPFRLGAEQVMATVQWSSAVEPVGLGLAFSSPSAVLADQILDAVLSGFWLADAEAPVKPSDTHLMVWDLKRLLEEI